ncbi:MULTISPECIES: glycosyltransferase family 39 protein [unclassified Mycolicibacterium]|uniref:glycosyltransferase family 39 protein n=1 Tax=unclassified Mycolicibacterium TaxID=2636767 RepID=UPI0012DCA161|nr:MULTISPECIES: glycosyltransferase family 39 protein [unclassified Mycolicibacterium]MUL84868.1 glycosyl transferase [Mycolicibacterium sp. CBMA 329]MUL90835.1 glycosyl transferase [Mycolicibacterium sp. CBMA 331]MUM01783.1 glycosyl transferase [Mycolicibacterium sp. CBMA 334]MUM26614.1 glycosyl transferase [Mycolicibacterium sp. CBMA 295]MUM40594.1 glycosyl transferase [Mycolicibacterium sp. CBMA 247]
MTTIVDTARDAATVTADSPDELTPRWVRPSYWVLLAGTALLYLWGLGSSGWANSYYAAAAQAGTQSWKAWLFGSLDAGNAITVDKPPAAMWAMGLSGRLFGFNEFTMLLPQALMGVGAVALLYATVRRTSGPGAALIAGVALALTPVAASMFRYNNPDALLVLLLVLAAYFMVRAVGPVSARVSAGWVALAGCALGFAFLTKMLQAFLIVPGLALMFLVAAPAVGVWKRLGTLLIGAATMVISSGWYIALVALWPADSRPYIAGSTDNSLLQLTFGYNGLQRILGHEGHGPGPGGPGPGPGGGANLMFGGDPGIGRMFGQSMGTEASWLLPAALIGLVAALWLTRRTARTAGLRAGLLMWGGWLLVTAVVFSFMDGIIHPYYTVALAPAVAALVGISVVELWRVRARLAARLVLAVMLAATGVWAFVLLNRTQDWLPALRWIVLIGSVLTAVVLAVVAHRPGKLPAVVALAAMIFGLGATAAYTIETVAAGHNGGPIATSGPKRDMGFGGPGGPGGPGGFGRTDDPALAELVAGADGRWAAASVGSMMISDLELKTGESLMAIGGFTGSDDSPTLAQFQQYVADGQIRYFLDRPEGGRGGPPRDEHGSSAQITDWVKANFTKSVVGNVAVYDLKAPRT